MKAVVTISIPSTVQYTFPFPQWRRGAVTCAEVAELQRPRTATPARGAQRHAARGASDHAGDAVGAATLAAACVSHALS